MLKHGIYQRETAGETVYDFYWMGEDLCEADFNERLRAQMKALMKDTDMIQMGMDLREAIGEGERVDRDLSQVEEVLARVISLPLCAPCREKILTVGGKDGQPV